MRNGGVLADGTLPEILAETKTKDADAAFLALADREDAKEKAA
jgi:hypothetical protein